MGALPLFHLKVNPDERIPVEFLVDNIVSIKKEYSLNEDGQVVSNIFIKKYFFRIKDLNFIKDLKAPRLKELCSEYDLEYTNVEDSKEILIKFTQDNFESLEKDIDYCVCKWSDIVPLMPVFEYYDSSDYGNPQRFVESTLRNIYRSFFYEYDGRSEFLRPEFASKINEIKKVLDQRIQESLKGKVTSKIYKIKNIYGDYSIDFAGGFSLSDILVDYGTGPLSISRIGEGSKKRLFLAIVEWDKEIKTKEPHKMVIRGYDEPDASLHYNAQKEMYYNLRDLSNDVTSQVQVIICTHSVSMIDRAPARIINHIKQQDGLSQVEFLKDDNEGDIKQFLDSISEISGIKNSSLLHRECGGSRIPQPSGWG